MKLLFRVQGSMAEHRAVVAELERSLIGRFGPARGVVAGVGEEVAHA